MHIYGSMCGEIYNDEVCQNAIALTKKAIVQN